MAAPNGSVTVPLPNANSVIDRAFRPRLGDSIFPRSEGAGVFERIVRVAIDPVTGPESKKELEQRDMAVALVGNAFKLIIEAGLPIIVEIDAGLKQIQEMKTRTETTITGSTALLAWVEQSGMTGKIEEIKKNREGSNSLQEKEAKLLGYQVAGKIEEIKKNREGSNSLMKKLQEKEAKLLGYQADLLTRSRDLFLSEFAKRIAPLGNITRLQVYQTLSEFVATQRTPENQKLADVMLKAMLDTIPSSEIRDLVVKELSAKHPEIPAQVLAPSQA